MTEELVIFDIDGTLADISTHLHHSGGDVAIGGTYLFAVRTWGILISGNKKDSKGVNPLESV